MAIPTRTELAKQVTALEDRVKANEVAIAKINKKLQDLEKSADKPTKSNT